MSQVFSEGFRKVSFFRFQSLYRTRLTREFELESTHFLLYPKQVRVELFFRRDPQICGCGRVGGDLRLRRVGCDKVDGKVARSVSHASPGTKNESCALKHVVDVA